MSRLFEDVRDTPRLHHYSPCTQDVYVAWVRRFVFAAGRRDPRELGSEDVRRFLTPPQTAGA